MGASCSKSNTIESEQATKNRYMNEAKMRDNVVVAKMLSPYGETREITPEVKTIQKLYGF